MRILPITLLVLTSQLFTSPLFAATDRLQWTLSVPVDSDQSGFADNISEEALNDDFHFPPYFLENPDNSFTFMAPVEGPKTSVNTKYTRSELREMLRRGDRSISTKGITANNWVFSTAPQEDLANAAAIDSKMEAELAVNHVTSTGDRNQIGRVIIGQIHANHDEPIRFYYRKLAHHNKGSLYFAHEPLEGEEQWYELIGGKSSAIDEPQDGIELNERFGYRIDVSGHTLAVTIMRDGKEDIYKEVDMSNSGYDQGGQYMYFKAGVYNQNNSGDPDDYVQATFYRIDTEHSTEYKE